MLSYFFIHMADLKIELKNNKKVYFASDLHLGLPTFSRDQEIAVKENCQLAEFN
jgi:hypothetical protein